MSPLEFRERTETQKLFLRLLEARGYDMRKVYDQVDPRDHPARVLADVLGVR